MKKSCLCMFIITFLFLGTVPAFGLKCEKPPFVEFSVTPNVLIILDNSGSTLTEDVPGFANRFEAAKTVITQLLSETEGFNWGLMRMDGAASTGERSEWDWQDPVTKYWFSTDSNFVRHGGKLLRPVGTDKDDIINYINGMEVYDTIPHTYTVNGETLFTAAQYFAGGHGPAGLGEYKQENDPTVNYEYRRGSKWYSARNTDDYGNTIDISSPIEHWCQQNFVIYLTDGESNCDSDWDRLLNLVGDYDGDGADDPNVDEWDESGGNHYVDDVAKWMYENDLWTGDDMPGVQNVVTYIVGLRINSPLLERAADDNHGRGMYFYAADYNDLKEAFDNIRNDIISKVSSGTAVAVQSTSTQNTRRLLRAKFVPGTWMGHLEAFKLPYSKGDSPIWDAGLKLRDKNPNDRYIFTAMDSKKGTGVEMNAKLLFTEANSGVADLDGNKLWEVLGAANDAEGDKIIRYIRGSSVNGYRVRSGGWKLGDIAYSSPVISGQMVFVGANDGMLHAFDINTGQEKWAFIPNNLLGKLKDLTLLAYEDCHEYFVDLSPKVAEISVGGVLKKILVGGERAGGKAVFALDITNAQNPDTVQPLWEFSDPALGESWTVPAVEPCWISGAEKWLAFVGSGRDNADSKGYLLAVDAVTGQKMGKELCLTGAPENQLPSLRAIDWDLDGYTDRIYVGCLQEKLFVVEVNSQWADPSKWSNKHILTTGNAGLFQPISIPTSLSLYEEAGATHVMVYFGTGKFYTTADGEPPFDLQSFYAVKDNAMKVGRGDLADQTNAGACADISVGFGWYIDLVQGPGEMVISSALVVGGYVFFTTFQPDADPCKAGGIARLYVVNYDNGCIPAGPVIDADRNGDVDENDPDAMIGGRTIEIGYGVPSDIVFDPSESTIIIQTSDTTIHQFKVDVLSNKLTIHSWREVLE